MVFFCMIVLLVFCFLKYSCWKEKKKKKKKSWKEKKKESLVSSVFLDFPLNTCVKLGVN